MQFHATVQATKSLQLDFANRNRALVIIEHDTGDPKAIHTTLTAKLRLCWLIEIGRVLKLKGRLVIGNMQVLLRALEESFWQVRRLAGRNTANLNKQSSAKLLTCGTRTSI